MTRNRVKKYSVFDMVSLTLGQGGHLTAQVQENVRIITKKYIFPSDEEAARFYHYVEYMRECGGVLSEVFLEMFPYSPSPDSLLTPSLITRALQSEDIQISQDLVNQMIMVPDLDGDGSLTYSEFFHIFFGTPLYSKRQCLMEWLRKAREGGVTVPGTRYHQMNVSSHQKQQAILNEKNEKMEGLGELLQGEMLVNSLQNVRWTISSQNSPKVGFDPIPGTMYLSNYRIIITGELSYGFLLLSINILFLILCC